MGQERKVFDFEGRRVGVSRDRRLRTHAGERTRAKARAGGRYAAG